jgi:predicted dehydrogenase
VERESGMTGTGAGPIGSLVLIGCGFVADLYMRSLATFPGLRVLGAHDRDAARMAAFCAHWRIPALPDIAAACAALPPDGLVLNLTNPASHAAVTRDCLGMGRHVWSEKPLTLSFAEAAALHALARDRGLQLASAPSSVLSEAAQTLARAVRDGTAGTPRLVYAELDDGFVPQAPVEAWHSESGAPWPWADEFRTGCTLEHAGYYLSWLIAMFGRVRTVVAASAAVIPDKKGVAGTAPDVSVATLFFDAGPVARLTCSIVAPHDHRIRVIGDAGVLEVARAWDNAAPVRFRRRLRIRRRLLESPLARRLRIAGPTHPRVARSGASAMNFALGPAEMLAAIAAGRMSRLAGDYALHLTEVTLAIQNAGEGAGAQAMTTGCAPMEPMPWAR